MRSTGTLAAIALTVCVLLPGAVRAGAAGAAAPARTAPGRRTQTVSAIAANVPVERMYAPKPHASGCARSAVSSHGERQCYALLPRLSPLSGQLGEQPQRRC